MGYVAVMEMLVQLQLERMFQDTKASIKNIDAFVSVI